MNKKKEDWSIPLPKFPTTWVDLCFKGLLLPGHVSHIFLRSMVSPQRSTFNPVASFVSALNLHKECPPTLLKALANSHPDWEVWLQSFNKEKGSLNSLNRPTARSLLASTLPSAKRVPLLLFLPCVS
jgi:hypothetical protein